MSRTVDRFKASCKKSWRWHSSAEICWCDVCMLYVHLVVLVQESMLIKTHGVSNLNISHLTFTKTKTYPMFCQVTSNCQISGSRGRQTHLQQQQLHVYTFCLSATVTYRYLKVTT